MKRASTEESPKAVEAETPATEAKTEPKAVKKKRYWYVRFHERSDDSQPEDIILTVNGETLVVRRGVTTILPEAYVEVADNATIMSMKYDPITNKTVPRVVKKLPFYREREATREEYLAMKAEGTQKTKEELKRREASGS